MRMDTHLAGAAEKRISYRQNTAGRGNIGFPDLTPDALQRRMA
jgi:hypothetical protein